MSYIRASYPLIYVEGDSEDYIYPTRLPDEKGEYTIKFIEDYGSISDSGLIELLFRYWKTEDNKFKEHLLKRLANRLNVKLRDRLLTNEEEMKLSLESTKKFKEENKEWLDSFNQEVKTKNE